MFSAAHAEKRGLMALNVPFSNKSGKANFHSDEINGQNFIVFFRLEMHFVIKR